MNTLIYGVDADQNPTPLQVRDALIACFYEAHCMNTGLEGADQHMSHVYCEEQIKKAFVDTGGDFENPTKESIMKVMGRLAEFSKQFRNQEVINKHFGEMMQLVEKIPS